MKDRYISMALLIVNSDVKSGKINNNIYGHFAEHLGRCIYEGVWVGKNSPIPNTDGMRNDVLEALKEIRIPVLRWPGGCFADEYHWMDGIGPAENRPKMINTHWGGVVENNHFGTHEFLRLCELIGAEPYICGNVGSGTVQEMQQWIEYITFDGISPMSALRKENGRDEPWILKYFGVGNENWGCGGNMLPEYYADVYRRYATYVRNFGKNKVYKIACGPNSSDYHWTKVMMEKAGAKMDGLSLHYYTVPLKDWKNKGSATEFDEDQWFSTLNRTLFMDELITKHSAIMDQYDPEKKVGLIIDEWGTWYDVEPGTNPGFLYQQNTIRDALVAGINLNIFNSHCDRVQMANIAQTINVLQAVILTQGEKMLRTPTYHVFNMFKVHQGAKLASIFLDSPSYTYNEQSIPQINASASIDANNRLNISLCNLNPNKGVDIDCSLRGGKYSTVTGTILTADTINAHNTFENTNNVCPRPFDTAVLKNSKLNFNMPAMSVVVLNLA